MNTHTIIRERMVQEQLVSRGITDTTVLKAMRTVPRHLFLPAEEGEALRAQAYEDYPLPIGFGQTISQPFVVAFMTQLLECAPGMRVLEVGTGSGYQAAVLREMGLDVHSVERLPDLHFRTSRLFRHLRFMDIRLKLADGTLGWPEAGPFDRILVTAGGPEVPAPLLEQLTDSGILVMPVGNKRLAQRLMRIRKQQGQRNTEVLEAVAFVDLVGKHGFGDKCHGMRS